MDATEALPQVLREKKKKILNDNLWLENGVNFELNQTCLSREKNFYRNLNNYLLFLL